MKSDTDLGHRSAFRSETPSEVTVCQRNIDCVKGNHGYLYQTDTQTKRMNSRSRSDKDLMK